MFEHIHFHHTAFDKPLSPNTSLTALKQYGIEHPPKELSEYYDAHAEETDFIVEGTAYSLYPPPITADSRKALLYMQVFGLLDAGSNYFTHRKNYESFLLLHTYEGKGILHYDGKEYALGKDDSALIDCRKEQRYYTSGSHWLHSTLHFTGHSAELFFQNYYQNGDVLLHHSPVSSYQQNIEKLLRISQEPSRFRDMNTGVQLEILLSELIKEKYQNLTTLPDYILYIQKYIENHFEKPLSLDMLADLASISKFHLAREFKRYTGFTVNEYLIAARLERASFLLANTTLPIHQICLATGFSNYSNFYKLFCKNIGCPPQNYRRQPSHGKQEK